MAEKSNSGNASGMTVYSFLTIITIILFLILMGFQVSEFLYFNQLG